MQIAALGVVALGIAGGIIWAERVSKKQGTQEFVSTIYRTPELEKEQDSK